MLMRYLKGFSVLLVLTFLVSSVLGYNIDLDSCENYASSPNIINFYSNTCNYPNFKERSACFESEVLVVSDVMEFDFNISEGDKFCQLEVVGENLDDLSVKLIPESSEQGLDFDYIETDGCVQKKYFKDLMSFVQNDEVLEAESIYSNSLLLEASDARVNSIKLVCLQNQGRVSENDLISEDLFVERNNVILNESFVADSVITGNLNFTYSLDYEFIMPTHGDDFEIENMPLGCVDKSNQGGTSDLVIVCNRSLGNETFSFKALQQGLFSYKTKINSEKINNGTLEVSTDFEKEVLKVENQLKFKLVDGSYKTLDELSYGDSLEYAEVVCADSSSSNVKFILKNINQRKSCVFFSNNKIGYDTFLVDITRNNYDGLGSCPGTFVLDKSGLYSFELSCGAGSCSGSCYDRIASDVDKTSWKSFLILGRYLFSFYNNNQIPDCICNSEGELTPVNIFSRDKDIKVQGFGGLVP